MVKKIFLATFMGMVLVLTTVSIARAGSYTSVLSANPIGLVFGIANVEYQKNVGDNSAWAIRGLYWGDKAGDWEWSALGVGGGYRGFFAPTAPAGGFWGVGLDLLNLSAKYTFLELVEEYDSYFD